MNSASTVAADLRDLSGDLTGESATSGGLSMLERDLRVAVRSFLGFTVTITVPGPAVSIAMNVVDEPLAAERAADWLSAQLPAARHGRTASIMIYAGEEHALDTLRGDLADALDIAPSALLSTAGPQTTIVPGVTGLSGFADVNRAAGVLMAAGHTYETACIELIRLAHHHPGGIVGAAGSVLRDVLATVVTDR